MRLLCRALHLIQRSAGCGWGRSVVLGRLQLHACRDVSDAWGLDLWSAALVIAALCECNVAGGDATAEGNVFPSGVTLNSSELVWTVAQVKFYPFSQESLPAQHAVVHFSVNGPCGSFPAVATVQVLIAGHVVAEFQWSNSKFKACNSSVNTLGIFNSSFGAGGAEEVSMSLRLCRTGSEAYISGFGTGIIRHGCPDDALLAAEAMMHVTVPSAIGKVGGALAVQRPSGQCNIYFSFEPGQTVTVMHRLPLTFPVMVDGCFEYDGVTIVRHFTLILVGPYRVSEVLTLTDVARGPNPVINMTSIRSQIQSYREWPWPVDSPTNMVWDWFELQPGRNTFALVELGSSSPAISLELTVVYRCFRAVLHRGGAGFFGQLLGSLKQLEWARKVGFDMSGAQIWWPETALDGEPNLYFSSDHSGSGSSWDYWFYPVGRPTEYCFDSEEIYYLDSNNAWENYRGDPLPYPSGPYSELLKEPVNGSWYNHHRSLGAELMHRYIVVRPHIKSVVEEFARLHFSGFVVGVHVRSTDKMCYADHGPSCSAVSLYDYIEHLRTIRLNTEEGGIVTVFVAGDSPRGVQSIVESVQELGMLAVSYDALREESNSLYNRAFNGYRKGEEVLIEMLLLSRVDFLLKPSSSVSEFAVWWSWPKLRYNCFEMQHPGQPLPSLLKRYHAELTRIDTTVRFQMPKVGQTVNVYHPLKCEIFIHAPFETATDVYVMFKLAGVDVAGSNGNPRIRVETFDVKHSDIVFSVQFDPSSIHATLRSVVFGSNSNRLNSSFFGNQRLEVFAVLGDGTVITSDYVIVLIENGMGETPDKGGGESLHQTRTGTRFIFFDKQAPAELSGWLATVSGRTILTTSHNLFPELMKHAAVVTSVKEGCSSISSICSSSANTTHTLPDGFSLFDLLSTVNSLDRVVCLARELLSKMCLAITSFSKMMPQQPPHNRTLVLLPRVGLTAVSTSRLLFNQVRRLEALVALCVLSGRRLVEPKIALPVKDWEWFESLGDVGFDRFAEGTKYVHNTSLWEVFDRERFVSRWPDILYNGSSLRVFVDLLIHFSTDVDVGEKVVERVFTQKLPGDGSVSASSILTIPHQNSKHGDAPPTESSRLVQHLLSDVDAVALSDSFPYDFAWGSHLVGVTWRASSLRASIRHSLRWKGEVWEAARSFVERSEIRGRPFLAFHFRRGDRGDFQETFPWGPWEVAVATPERVVAFLSQKLQETGLEVVFIATNSGKADELDYLRSHLPVVFFSDRTNTIFQSNVEQAVCVMAEHFVRSPSQCHGDEFTGVRSQFGLWIEEERRELGASSASECCGDSPGAATVLPSRVRIPPVPLPSGDILVTAFVFWWPLPLPSYLRITVSVNNGSELVVGPSNTMARNGAICAPTAGQLTLRQHGKNIILTRVTGEGKTFWEHRLEASF